MAPVIVVDKGRLIQLSLRGIWKSGTRAPRPGAVAGRLFSTLLPLPSLWRPPPRLCRGTKRLPGPVPGQIGTPVPQVVPRTTNDLMLKPPRWAWVRQMGWWP